MYTLINCPKAGCSAAQDKISLQIKEGASGSFKEVYVVSGRSNDTKWNQELFSFRATQTLVYVRILALS